jgi:fructose-bisphosphate aldolase class 1
MDSMVFLAGGRLDQNAEAFLPTSKREKCYLAWDLATAYTYEEQLAISFR